MGDWTNWLIGGAIGALISIPLTLLLSDPMNEIIMKILWHRGGNSRQRFAGYWKATYVRLDEPGQTPIQETIVLRQVGSRVVGCRLNERKVRIEGQIRERYLTGYWYDTGDRANRWGAFQCSMDAGGHDMSGKWIGFSSSQGRNIRYGSWDWNLHRD